MKERIIEIGRRIIRARQAYETHDPVTGEVNKKPRLVVGKPLPLLPGADGLPGDMARSRGASSRTRRTRSRT
jgi:hypothetical protein